MTTPVHYEVEARPGRIRRTDPAVVLIAVGLALLVLGVGWLAIVGPRDVRQAFVNSCEAQGRGERADNIALERDFHALAVRSGAPDLAIKSNARDTRRSIRAAIPCTVRIPAPDVIPLIPGV